MLVFSSNFPPLQGTLWPMGQEKCNNKDYFRSLNICDVSSQKLRDQQCWAEPGGTTTPTFWISQLPVSGACCEMGECSSPLTLLFFFSLAYPHPAPTNLAFTVIAPFKMKPENWEETELTIDFYYIPGRKTNRASKVMVSSWDQTVVCDVLILKDYAGTPRYVLNRFCGSKYGTYSKWTFFTALLIFSGLGAEVVQ